MTDVNTFDFVGHAHAFARARNLTVSQINGGQCEAYAQELLTIFPQGDIQYTDQFIPMESSLWPGGHAWIAIDGKLYDATTPQGVDHWTALAFFQDVKAIRVRSD